MNIWTWVDDLKTELHENGQERLAALMDRLPSAVLEDENSEVEAIVPEALALARSLELPWVEIFVRHWHLQATGDGFEKLPDAIETLEFSHRADHVACPQSVCTVQDVSKAYSGADGPGYVEERLQVCDETLARIDSSWACWVCINGQKVGALTDAGRHEEAIELARATRAEMKANGLNTQNQEDTEAGALLALGRYEEALEVARSWEGERDDTFARDRALTRAQALLGLGRAAEAKKELIALDIVLGEPRYQLEWAEIMAGLIDAGETENDWRVGATLELMVAAQAERGRAWDGFQLAEVHARVALKREAPSTARRALENARGFAARLRDPDRVADRIAALQAEIEAAPEPDAALPETIDELSEQLQQEPRDPERSLERLYAAVRRWPDEIQVAWWLHVALDALQRDDEALDVLREYAEAHPSDEAWQTYGHALVDAGRFEAVEAVAERVERGPNADWLLARCAYLSGEPATARECAQRVIDADPDALNSRRLLALTCEVLDDFEAALEHRNEVLERDENANDHWNRMVSATVVGDWAAVRASAAFLEIELPGDEGPIDVDGEYIRLQYDPRDIVIAQRTGPVSARVLSVSNPGTPQHAGDLVVFDAAPIGEVEEGKLTTFPAVKTLSEGPRRIYPFDGVRPDDDAWNAFYDALADQGWVVDVRSGEAYELEVDGAKKPAIYGWFAVPVEEAEAHERLSELTADWEQPFTWLPLAEEAGAEDVVEQWRELAEELALY